MTPRKCKEKIINSKPLARFLGQSAFTTAFTYLTSGVFLSGLAILMGASDVLGSYLSVTANICGVLIIVLSPMIERIKSRKLLAVGFTILSRITTLLIVTVPLIIPPNMRIPVFIAVVAVAFTLQAQTTIIINQWMLQYVDDKKRGRYVSLRQTLALIATVVLSFTSGYWMDYVNKEYIGFVILFVVAGMMAVVEIVLLIRIPDSKVQQVANNAFKMSDIVKIPIKNKSFFGFVIYILIFYLMLYISDSFTTVYMIRYLELSYQTVNALFMIISIPQIILLSIWGKISDKYGHNFVLKLSIWLFAGETLFMIFAGGSTWIIFIPLAFIIASIANAGFVISVFNRKYELMPSENRIVYDNFYTAVIGIGFILGPMIGGIIKSGIESNTVLMQTVDFASIRFLYVISTVGILLLQFIYLLACRKKGTKKLAE